MCLSKWLWLGLQRIKPHKSGGKKALERCDYSWLSSKNNITATILVQWLWLWYVFLYCLETVVHRYTQATFSNTGLGWINLRSVEEEGAFPWIQLATCVKLIHKSHNVWDNPFNWSISEIWNSKLSAELLLGFMLDKNWPSI